MNTLNKMTITAWTIDVLQTLRKNRETHATIVAEARQGYVDEAQRVLKERLKQLAEGKIVSLTFQLQPPRDFTNVYNIAITMLELHQNKTIELASEMVRCLVMDEWDWTRDFLFMNSVYSDAARRAADEKGYKLSEDD